MGDAAVSTIAVGIVEDLDEIREGLADLLTSSPGFACTGVWRSMEDALRALRSRRPEILLVDLGLPGMDGIEGIRRVREAWPAIVPVVLTVYQDDDRIIQALCAGARGYLLKKTSAPEILARLEEAAAGGAPMSPEIARLVVSLFSRFVPSPGADHGLTPHEVRVLKLLGRPQLPHGRLAPRRHALDHRLPRAEDLRQARGPLEDRGRDQGSTGGASALTRASRSAHRSAQG